MKAAKVLGRSALLLALLMLAVPAAHAQLTQQQTCTFGVLNQNNWVQINVLVVVMVLTISGLIYSLSNILPVQTREKTKGAVKTEGVQAILSLIIILAVLAFATFSCGLVSGLTSSLLLGSGNYPVQASSQSGLTPIEFSNYYVENLLFNQGVGITQALFAKTTTMMVAAEIVDYVSETSVLNTGLQVVSNPVFSLSYGLGTKLSQIFYVYSFVFSDLYAGLVVVTFGLLLLLFLLLPIIYATALTIVLPVALVLRSLPFMGPRFRQASDSFLALAIAFYFILPMTLALNAYIVNWMFTPYNPGCSAAHTMCGNPYSAFVGPYTINNIPAYALFASNTVTPQALCGSGNGLCTFGNLQTNFFSNVFGFSLLGNVPQTLLGVPQAYINMGDLVSQYLFQGIVLLAVDMAILIGFSQGLAKGLGAVSEMIGAGAFWKV